MFHPSGVVLTRVPLNVFNGVSLFNAVGSAGRVQDCAGCALGFAGPNMIRFSGDKGDGDVVLGGSGGLST